MIIREGERVGGWSLEVGSWYVDLDRSTFGVGRWGGDDSGTSERREKETTRWFIGLEIENLWPLLSIFISSHTCSRLSLSCFYTCNIDWNFPPGGQITFIDTRPGSRLLSSVASFCTCEPDWKFPPDGYFTLSTQIRASELFVFYPVLHDSTIASLPVTVFPNNAKSQLKYEVS